MIILQETAFQVFQNYQAYVAIIVLLFTMIGLWGRSLAVGAFVAYMAFARIAIATQTTFFIQMLYVTAILVMVGMGFKVWRAEFGGE